MSSVTSRVVFLGGAALLAVLALSAASRRSALPGSARPDIILITVDSLRADALGVYGYAKDTSPNLDAFAGQAVVAATAVAQAPFTKASIASLMTGLFPGAHKTYTSSKPAATILKRNGVVKGTFEITDALPFELPTLAEQLAAAGYLTAGFSTNPYLIHDLGYDKGFSTFRFFNNGETYARAPEVLREARRALIAPHSRPVFVWIHLMDTHNPYAPAEPYRLMFQPERPSKLIPEEAIDPAVRIEGSRDLQVYRARYDACVRETDARLGAFFADLRAARLWDRAAVVVTADHGEEFFEHGHLGHNTALYDEQVRVPLIMKIPGIRPARLQGVVQLLDLYPTLLHVAGRRAADSHGTDLMPALTGAAPPPRYGFSELPGHLWAARSEEWKLISGMPGTGKLFDLVGDPGETRNVRATASHKARSIERALAGMISTEVRDGERVAQRHIPIDPKVVDQLRALGYLSRH